MQACSVASVMSLWTVACQAPLSMGFSREEHWSGLPCPPPGGLPDPGIEHCLLQLMHCRRVLYRWATREALTNLLYHFKNNYCCFPLRVNRKTGSRLKEMTLSGDLAVMKRRKKGHSLVSLICHTTPDYPHRIFHLRLPILQDCLHFKNMKTKMQGRSLTFLPTLYSAESYNCIPDLFDSNSMLPPSIVLFPVWDMSLKCLLTCREDIQLAFKNIALKLRNTCS